MIVLTPTTLVREYAEPAVRSLTISTYAGLVKIQRGHSRHIIITTTKRVEGKRSAQDRVAAENQVHLEAGISRSEVNVVARSMRSESGRIRTSVDIDISLPKRLDVTIQDISSKIVITAPLDRLAVHTISGTASIRGAVRSIRGWTASGLLSVHQTGRAEHLFRRAILRSASGAIAFTANALPSNAKVDVESTSGIVRINIEGGPVPNASASSVSGSSKIIYPAHFKMQNTLFHNGAKIIAHTVSGSVLVDLSKCGDR